MKQGNIYYTDKDFTDLEVASTFKYPCMLILKNAENEIVKITTYDEFGNKSVSNLETYSQTEINNYLALKLDKGTYTGTASDLNSLIDTKISGSGTANYIPKFSATGTIANSIIYETNNKIGVNTTPSDTLDIKTVGQGSIRFGGANGRTISAYSSTGASMNIDFASGASFLGNLYGSNIFDFATNKQSVRLSSTNITFWTNSLQRLTLDINGNIGIGASPTEKLDIAGRAKSDGIVINETTSAILPREIKFKDGKFKAALADGVEKSIAFEGESSSLLIAEGVYNENVVVNVQSVDYTTGIITTVGNHGFSEGDPLYIFPNSCLDFVNNNSTYERDLKSIPYEWVSQGLKVHVISSTQIQVYNGSNALISVNQTSTENNGNLTTPYYHFQKIIQAPKNWLQIPKGHKRVKIVVYMFTGGYWVYRHLLMNIWQGNTFISNYNVPGVDFMGKNGASTLAALPVKQSIFSILEIEWNAESRLGTYIVVENYYYRNTGAFTITATKVNQQDTTIAIAPNDGIAGIGALIQNFIANGTIIKVYKY